MKARIRRIQARLGTTADGIIGPQTLAALEEALGLAAHRWPTQAEVRACSSIFGSPGCEDKLVSITPPYTLYYAGQPVRSIRVHKAVARDVEEALAEVLAHYGPEEIHHLGLDVYDGSYSYRRSTGGSALSMHSWGIALDFAAACNGMSTHAPQASLSRPECEAWWRIWESHGAVSMGRERDYDWMHLQFARL